MGGGRLGRPPPALSSRAPEGWGGRPWPPKMPAMRGLLAPQNTIQDTIATRIDGPRESRPSSHYLPDQLSLARVPSSPVP